MSNTEDTEDVFELSWAPAAKEHIRTDTGIF